MDPSNQTDAPTRAVSASKAAKPKKKRVSAASTAPLSPAPAASAPPRAAVKRARDQDQTVSSPKKRKHVKDARKRKRAETSARRLDSSGDDGSEENKGVEGSVPSTGAPSTLEHAPMRKKARRRVIADDSSSGEEDEGVDAISPGEEDEGVDADEDTMVGGKVEEDEAEAMGIMPMESHRFDFDINTKVDEEEEVDGIVVTREVCSVIPARFVVDIPAAAFTTLANIFMVQQNLTNTMVIRFVPPERPGEPGVLFMEVSISQMDRTLYTFSVRTIVHGAMSPKEMAAYRKWKGGKKMDPAEMGDTAISNDTPGIVIIHRDVLMSLFKFLGNNVGTVTMRMGEDARLYLSRNDRNKLLYANTVESEGDSMQFVTPFCIPRLCSFDVLMNIVNAESLLEIVGSKNSKNNTHVGILVSHILIGDREAIRMKVTNDGSMVSGHEEHFFVRQQGDTPEYVKYVGDDGQHVPPVDTIRQLESEKMVRVKLSAAALRATVQPRHVGTLLVQKECVAMLYNVQPVENLQVGDISTILLASPQQAS